MTTVHKAVAAAVLAATALAGASTAFAGTDPSVSPTDLYIAVWNPSTSTSIVQDLGASFSFANLYSTGTGGFQQEAGFSVSSASLDGGNLATDLGAGTYSYGIFAGDYSNPSAGTYIGDTLLLGITAGSGAPTLQNGDIINGGLLAAVRTYLVTTMGSATTYKGTGTTYWAATPNQPGAGGGEYRINAYQNLGAQTIGSNMNLVSYVGAGTADVPTDNSTHTLIGNSAHAGVFTLTGDVLSYNLAAAGAVPLPAAGWLLISGLLGLGAVARRRGGTAIQGSLAA